MVFVKLKKLFKNIKNCKIKRVTRGEYSNGKYL